MFHVLWLTIKRIEIKNKFSGGSKQTYYTDQTIFASKIWKCAQFLIQVDIERMIEAGLKKKKSLGFMRFPFLVATGPF